MSSSHVNIGQTRQLFLDDHIVEEARDVVWQVHRPRRHLANPIVKADQPWEQNGGGVDLYGGTVFYDEEDEIFQTLVPRLWVAREGFRRPMARTSRELHGLLRHFDRRH